MNQLLFLVTLFLIRSSIYLYYPMLGKEIYIGDAYVRIMMVFQSLGEKYVELVWLPLPLQLIQTSLNIYNDIFISPRILSILINLLLILVLYFFTKNLFGQSVGLVTVLLFSVTPFFSYFFTAPMTEPLFALFFITGLLFIFKKKANIFIAIIFFNLAHMVRYESWYLFPLVCYFILKNFGIKKTLFFALMYFIYPVLWIRQNYIQAGDPFYFLTEKVNIAHNNRDYFYFRLLEPVKTWLYYFFVNYGILNLIFLFLGVKSKKNSRIIWIIFISLYLILALIVQVFLGTMEWYPNQYLYTSLIILLPVTAKGIVFFLKKLKNNLLVLFCLICLYLYFAIKNDYLALALKQRIPNVSQILRRLDIKDYPVYIYREERFPFDRDYIMYFTKQRYTSIEFQEVHKLIYNREFFDKYLILDQIDKDRVCKRCSLIYQDRRHIIIKNDAY